MRVYNRLIIAVSALALASLAACGSDSTGPSSETPAKLAAHFDSLYTDASAKNNSAGLYDNRILFTTFLEIPAALGASPSSVSITTATGSEQWKTYQILELTPRVSSLDSQYIFLAYRDADAHTLLFASSNGAGALQFAGIITADTIAFAPTGGSGSTGLTSVGATCATPSASLVNPQLDSLGISSCSLAKFTTSLSLQFATHTGVDPALTSITFSGAAVNGIRVVDAASSPPVPRLTNLLRAASLSRTQ